MQSDRKKRRSSSRKATSSSSNVSSKLSGSDSASLVDQSSVPSDEALQSLSDRCKSLPHIIIKDVMFSLTKDSLEASKVQALKCIAQHMQLKTSGRKTELIERIIQYFTENPDVAQYMNGPEPPASQKQCAKIKSSSECHAKSIQKSSVTHKKVQAYETNDPFKQFESCLCGGLSPSWLGSLLKCTSCSTQMHSTCMRWTSAPEAFLCSKCRFLQMDPFFPPVQVLWFAYIHASLPGVTLTKTNDSDNGTICQMGLSGNIKIQDLQAWRRRQFEIIIRCSQLKCERNKLLEHHWPRTLDLSMKNNVQSITAPSNDHKRRDVPMIITHLMKSGQNVFKISATEIVPKAGINEVQSHAIAILLCQTKIISELMGEIKDASPSLDESRKRVVTTLESTFRQSDPDDDIACLETNCKMKLICPITLTRMIVASRGRNCLHLQCFDLESYLTVTKSSKAFNNRWKCPECTNIIMPCDLVVDNYVVSILTELETSANVTTVEFKRDGAWKAIEENWVAESQEKLLSEKTSEFQPLIVDDLDSETALVIENISKKSKKRPRPNISSLPGDRVIIDISFSSDEETCLGKEPLPKRACLAYEKETTPRSDDKIVSEAVIPPLSNRSIPTKKALNLISFKINPCAPKIIPYVEKSRTPHFQTHSGPTMISKPIVYPPPPPPLHQSVICWPSIEKCVEKPLNAIPVTVPFPKDLDIVFQDEAAEKDVALRNRFPCAKMPNTRILRPGRFLHNKQSITNGIVKHPLIPPVSPPMISLFRKEPSGPPSSTQDTTPKLRDIANFKKSNYPNFSNANNILSPSHMMYTTQNTMNHNSQGFLLDSTTSKEFPILAYKNTNHSAPNSRALTSTPTVSNNFQVPTSDSHLTTLALMNLCANENKSLSNLEMG